MGLYQKTKSLSGHEGKKDIVWHFHVYWINNALAFLFFIMCLSKKLWYLDVF